MNYWSIVLAGFVILVSVVIYQIWNLMIIYTGTKAARKKTVVMVIEGLLNYAEDKIDKDSWIAEFLMRNFTEQNSVGEAIQKGDFLKIPYMFSGRKYYLYEKYNGRDFRQGHKVYAIIDGNKVYLKLCPGLKLRLKDGDLNSSKIEVGEELVDFSSENEVIPENSTDFEKDDLYS